MESFRFKTPEEPSQDGRIIELGEGLRDKEPEASYNTELDSLRSARPEEKTQESFRREIKKKADSAIEQAVFESEFVGSGKDAVVFKLPEHAFSQETLTVLKEDGMQFPDDSEFTLPAAKILKVYRPGEGVREYEMQKEAFDILSREENSVRIPTPIGIRDQDVTERDRDFLNRHGARLSENMEVILMDYIDGKDLATIMYEFVLTKKGYEPGEIEKMSFEDMNVLVANALDFAVPGRKHADESAKQLEENAVMNENSEKLFKFLKKNGFLLEKQKVARIENGLKTLSRHNIHHNDMHERNIIFGNDGEVYLIDFGRSVRNIDEGTTDDFAPVRRWTKLTTTAEEDEAAELRKTFSEMERSFAAIKSNPKWKERYGQVKAHAANGNLLRLANEFIIAQSSATDTEKFIAMIKALLNDVDLDPEVKDGIRELALGLPMQKMPPFARNKIQQALNAGWFA